MLVIVVLVLTQVIFLRLNHIYFNPKLPIYMQAPSSPFSIRNIRLFIAFRILFNARFYYPVFTILFLDYGLTIEQFALLNSVWAITIVLAEVPSGALADIIGRKRLVITTSLLMLIELAIIAFIPIENITLVFWAFLTNRVLSGLAEAMASGADEAIAYDSLAEKGLEKSWPKVLSLQMRISAVASMITATVGALVYDPNIVNKLLSLFNSSIAVNQQQTMRYPIFLTLVLAVGAVLCTFSFTETRKNPVTSNTKGFLANMIDATKLTLRAGGWIIKTPFALAIISFGMFYDHIIRMLITMTSQYFRLIQLPEASFGLISAGLSLIGIVIPKVCEMMVAKNTAAKNLFILFGITLLGIIGLSQFYPYVGLIFMASVYVGIMMTSFFTSNYLNLITSSEQRATVLSFKGMAFNLAYGSIGIMFAILIQQLRTANQAAHPGWSQQMVEDTSFVQSIGWFPWYTVLLFIIFLICFRKLLANDQQYKKLSKSES